MTYRETAEFLFGLLDDIDTEEDICKGNLKAFSERVHRIHVKRWQTGITTDGYALTFPAPK